MGKRFTEVEVGDFWDRRQSGEWLRSIGRRLGRSGGFDPGVCGVVGWGASTGSASCGPPVVVDRKGRDQSGVGCW